MYRQAAVSRVMDSKQDRPVNSIQGATTASMASSTPIIQTAVSPPPTKKRPEINQEDDAPEGPSEVYLGGMSNLAESTYANPSQPPGSWSLRNFRIFPGRPSTVVQPPAGTMDTVFDFTRLWNFSRKSSSATNSVDFAFAH